MYIYYGVRQPVRTVDATTALLFDMRYQKEEDKHCERFGPFKFDSHMNLYTKLTVRVIPPRQFSAVFKERRNF